MVDIADIVTYTNFGDRRLRGFWVAGGQISPSPIDFHRRPYNTLALPCERVINSLLHNIHRGQTNDSLIDYNCKISRQKTALANTLNTHKQCLVQTGHSA